MKEQLHTIPISDAMANAENVPSVISNARPKNI